MSDSRSITDAEGFEGAVLDLLPDLFGAAMSMAGTKADAEDLVSDAVARAWERRTDLRDPDRFRGWMFRILRNGFLARCRSRAARPETVALPDDGAEEASFSLFDRLQQPFLLWWGNPERQFLDNLLGEDLRAALDALSPPLREVVTLVDLRGFRYSEVAEVLDIPVGTVRSRLARGRSRMQEALWTHAVDRGLRTSPVPDRGERTSPVPSRGDEE